VAWAAPGDNDAERLRQRQIAQEKARAMAGELVSSILDIQIKQLQENGLDKLPIFTEITGMRKNIDALVEAEMQDVVKLLVEAQEGTKEERLAEAHFGPR
jgi:dephospho-CoA kinase